MAYSRILLFVGLLALLSGNAFAQPPLALERINEFSQEFYSGQVTLPAHFIARWDVSENDDRNPPEPYLSVFVILDTRTVGLFPRAKPGELWLRNTQHALTSLMGKSLAALLSSGSIQRVEGDATIVINKYQAGVDCDQWGYSAELVSAGEIRNIESGTAR
jgi:hypothetical protein